MGFQVQCDVLSGSGTIAFVANTFPTREEARTWVKATLSTDDDEPDFMPSNRVMWNGNGQGNRAIPIRSIDVISIVEV